MPTLEQLLRRASRSPRRPARPRVAALWPMPDDPDVLPDLIQTGTYPDEAQTVEERIISVYRQRQAAIWAYIAPEAGKCGSRPWAACPPPIWDPDGVGAGEHRDGWASSHWAFDFLPGPSGLQHRVNITDQRFVSHGVAASVLPQAPD